MNLILVHLFDQLVVVPVLRCRYLLGLGEKLAAILIERRSEQVQQSSLHYVFYHVFNISLALFPPEFV